MTSTALPLSRPSPALAPLRWRREWLDMDKNPRALAFAASIPGMASIHAAFALALVASWQLSTPFIALTLLTLAGCAAFPQRRFQVIVAASLLFVFLRPFRTAGFSDMMQTFAGALPAWLGPVGLQSAAVAAFLAFAFLALETQRRFGGSTLARRPVMVHLLVFWALALVAHVAPAGGTVHAALWAFVAVWASCFWMLAYAATDQKASDATPNAMRAALMRPFWGGSAIPIGKNHGYLAKFEARTEDDLAVTRLKALKLIVWAVLLNLLLIVLETVLRDHAGLPTLDETVAMQMEGRDAPLAIRWASLVSNYFLDLILIAVWGHVIVAIVRMAGYRIPRNTVNPLASRSLAEFWNRYFFYFKEVLVDFFFYPAFLRYFKKWPKLRIAFATFAAACLGNILFHVMADVDLFTTRSFADALAQFQNFFFYTLLLAGGLIVSQLRGRKPKPADGFLRYHLMPRVNVCLFFCFLKVFDTMFGPGDLGDRMTYFLGLFGV